MTRASSNDPLHGITLEEMVTRLVDVLGFEQLGRQIRVRSFTVDPSIASSLTFLRRTPWAREKVEQLFLYVVIRHGKVKPR
ncbi:MAG: VF530 family DNA-binding protein [Candidatus Binatia bacterium]